MILERKVMKSMPKTQKTLKTLSKINISEPKWRAPACVLKNQGCVLKNRGCVLKKPPLRFEKTSGVPLRLKTPPPLDFGARKSAF